MVQKTIKIEDEDHERLDKARRILSALLDEDMTFGETAGLLSQSFVEDTNLDVLEDEWSGVREN